MEQLRLNLKRTVQLASTSSAAQSDYEAAKYTYDAMEQRVNKLKAAYELMVEGARKERHSGAPRRTLRRRKPTWKRRSGGWTTRISRPRQRHDPREEAERKATSSTRRRSTNGLSASLCDMADLSSWRSRSKCRSATGPACSRQNCLVVPDAFLRDEEFRKKHPRGFEGVVSRIMPQRRPRQGGHSRCASSSRSPREKPASTFCPT